jgi:predicted phage tail protein
VKTAADYCDVTVTIPGGSEKRFTCNGVLTTANTHRENIEGILSSMGGSLTYTGGKFRIRAHMWEAAAGALTDDDIGDNVRLIPTTKKADRFNTVRATIYDATRDYQEMDAGEMTAVAA